MLDRLLRKKISHLAMLIANPYTFIFIVCASLTWFVYGSIIGFPEKMIRITEVVLAFGTFFTVFIVQFSEETDTTAVQKKLDAIIDADENIDQSAKGKELELKGKEKE